MCTLEQIPCHCNNIVYTICTYPCQKHYCNMTLYKHIVQNTGAEKASLHVTYVCMYALFNLALVQNYHNTGSTNITQPWTSHLAISYPISVQYDPVWEGPVDFMVVAESRGHAELEVVSKLLTSELEHGLGVVSGGSCDKVM